MGVMKRQGVTTLVARRVLVSLLSIASSGLIIGCRRPGPPAPVAIRFVDLFTPKAVHGTPAISLPTAPARTEWRFDGTVPLPAPKTFLPTRGWEAGPSVTALAIQNGLLTGRTSGDFPILHLERTSGLDNPDQLHAVEIRMRISAGANLSVDGSSREKIDLVEAQKQGRIAPWRITTPLLPGDEMRTYTLTPPTHLAGSDIRHLLLRPTDAPGATFAIESLRLVFRKEYLASVPSGVGWQGLKEVYRESLVSRAPETLRFEIRLPDRPWLDLALGTLDDGPVTFRVAVGDAGASEESGAATILDETVSTPHRWESRPLDLSRFAGRTVTIALSLHAEQSGALGLWGAPVVRAHGAMPSPAAAGSPPNARPQGVILIHADTLRLDHLDVYGYPRPTAPVLKRMAAEGALFRGDRSQATWTKVATPSLMTSLYPSSHGVKEFSDRLASSATTLAEAFRSAGYATLSFSSVLFTGQFTNLHQGFDELHESGSVVDPESSKTAREFVDRLLAWLPDHRDAPFFVYLHVFDPHDPYEPHSPYNALWFDPAKKEEHVQQARDVKKFIVEPLAKQFGMPSRAELVKAGFDPDEYVGRDVDWYDGSIRAMDVEIGRLLERLRGLGLDDRTLVVFTSDHGEEFLDHGHMFHGQTVYGELTDVPLIVRWPGHVPRGAVIDETVESIDVMPTLLELSQVEAPKGMQGQSLVPLLAAAGRGADTPLAPVAEWKRRPAISEKAVTTEVMGAPWPQDTESYSIVDGGWKLIYNRTRGSEAPEYELYDVARDRLDLHDLAARNPQVVTRLAKALDGWRAMAQAARLKSDTDAAKGLSQEQLQRLRSLGYIK